VAESNQPVTNGTSDKTFVDSNVLIYAHDVDAGRRHEIAKGLLQRRELRLVGRTAEHPGHFGSLKDREQIVDGEEAVNQSAFARARDLPD